MTPRSRGTRGERWLAWAGIILGALGGIGPGIWALYSFSRWQDGGYRYPGVAWFLACGSISTAPVALVVALTSTNGGVIDAGSGESLAYLAAFGVGGCAGMFLLAKRHLSLAQHDA